MKIQPWTFGMGDRFARQGLAQLDAVIRANADGIPVFPAWNKSNREHTIVGSEPADLAAEARAATGRLGWDRPYYVDADHVSLQTVDRFLAASNFFTIDVAAFIGQPAAPADIDRFITSHRHLLGRREIPGLAEPLEIDEPALRATAGKFLLAIQEAARTCRHIAAAKGDDFVAEISIDETDEAQTPLQMLGILALIAHEGIPAQTIAPKFTGRFNKGVDYVGDLARFETEFDADLCILTWAVQKLGLPETLKLSVHSGSDKFSLYPIINRLVKKHRCGLHVKTAGTTWLEEMIGLAESGGEALALAKRIYLDSLPHYDALVGPYATVVDIAPEKLPTPREIEGWGSGEFCAALRHDPTCPAYNADFRQFIHVSFKTAAKLGPLYTDALEAHADIIGRNVTHNLLARHLRPIFG